MIILASSNPLTHVVDHIYRTVTIGGVEVTVASRHTLAALLAAVLLIGLVCSASRRRTDRVPHGLANFFEAICQYLRQHVAQPALGDLTDRFIPYIWSTFFFVLFCNLLGLIPNPFGLPFLGTATGNIWMTGALAFCTLVMVVYNGLRLQGVEYLKHFMPGPIALAPLMIVVEIIGLIAKICALAIRLFANMVAGHVLLAVLASFIDMAFRGLGVGIGSFAIAGVVVVGSVAINMLELFVAFLQAFIFTFLTTLFIGQAVVIHHQGEEQH